MKGIVGAEGEAGGGQWEGLSVGKQNRHTQRTILTKQQWTIQRSQRRRRQRKAKTKHIPTTQRNKSITKSNDFMLASL